jgi:hypothetical protein
MPEGHSFLSVAPIGRTSFAPWGNIISSRDPAVNIIATKAHFICGLSER